MRIAASLAWLALYVLVLGGTIMIPFVILRQPRWALLTGILCALVFGADDLLAHRHISPVEEFSFSWRAIWSGIRSGLLSSLFWACLVFWYGKSLMLGLLTFGFCLLLGFLMDGLQGKPLTERTKPNAGSERSLRVALTFATFSFLLALVTRGIEYRSDFTWAGRSHLLVRAASNGIPVAVILIAVLKGGSFAFQHYCTRGFLCVSRLMPLRAVLFLDECTERLFLIRKGGSYEFFHATFRDYLATLHRSN